MTMRVGIVDADLMDNGTRHPNLALMKISGYHKDLGNEVNLIFESYEYIKQYEIVYISKVFNFTKIPKWVLEAPNVIYGGTGFYENGGPSLPYEIEHHKPYYDLYKEYIAKMTSLGKNPKKYFDYQNYSIGFTTRGCFRKCEFCVNKKYDKVQRHANVKEFLDEERPMIYLWDDNILGYDKWQEVIDELADTGKPFQFRQGIDLRLMNDAKAHRLNQIKYHGDFIFAFDNIEEKNLIINKVQLWKRYSSKVPKMYVMCGFKSIDANDIIEVFERIYILMKYGSIPYIMRFEEYKKSNYRGMYIQLARWCNQPKFFKKMSFREFCERNEYYNSNPNKFCSSYRTMLAFEEEYPEIAKKYFNIKFSDENIYNINYGYGRRYCNKQECYQCKIKMQNWDEIVKGNLPKVNWLYYNKEIDLLCLMYKNSECKLQVKNATDFLVQSILNINFGMLFTIIQNCNNIEELNKSNCVVPRYRNEFYFNLLNIIFQDDKTEKHLLKNIDKKLDIIKNKEKIMLIDSLKLLAIMDLIILSKDNISGVISLSPLGEKFIEMKIHDKENIWSKNIFRLPVVQHYINVKMDNELIKEKINSSKVTNTEEIIVWLKNWIKEYSI